MASRGRHWRPRVWPPYSLNSGANGQAETALNEGAGYEQAGASAAISAAAEVLTEKLSGGVKFGGKTLDDVLLKPLTDQIANKTWRAFANLGLDSIGEGLEEVFSGAINRLGTALYKKERLEELLLSEEALNEYIESFVGAFVLGNASSAAKLAFHERSGGILKTPTVDSVMPQVPPTQAQVQEGKTNTVDPVIPNLRQEKNASFVGAETQKAISIMEPEPIKVGRATVLKSPYKGKTPTYEKPQNRAILQIGRKGLKAATSQIEAARTQQPTAGKSFKKIITEAYERLFDMSGGARSVEVFGLHMDGKPYFVDINKSVIGKVISDTNMSAEKLAVLDVLDGIVENGEYVGSSNYIPHGSKKKNTVRFDHFETQIQIDSMPYLVTFDVEVFPSRNNYRTHKVINEMDLTPIPSAGTGSDLPQGSGKQDPPKLNLPRPERFVNEKYEGDLGAYLALGSHGTTNGTDEGV